MKPRLQVQLDNGRCRAFGALPTHPPAILYKIGYMDNISSYWERPAQVYQEVAYGPWCASRWDTIPPDELWRCRGEDGMLLTSVLRANLDWRSTPFEHRYNLSMERTRTDELITLAGREYIVWGESSSFIPFKGSRPQGYQGVVVSFDCLSESSTILDVYDAFSPNHVLRMEW